MKAYLVLVGVQLAMVLGIVGADLLHLQTGAGRNFFQVYCSINEFSPSPNISHVLALVLSRIDGDKEEVIASISSVNQSTPFSPQGLNVTGHITDTEGVLHVDFPERSPHDLASYKCDATGLNSHYVLVNYSGILRSWPHPVSQASLIATPRDIKVGVTKSLTVHCSVINSPSAAIDKVISIELLRIHDTIQQLIAQVDTFTGFSLAQGVDGAIGKGQTGTYPSDSYLNVTWEYPTSKQAGKYTCKISGLDTGNAAPALFSADTRVYASDASREELTSKIRELYSLNEACEKHNA